MITNLEEANIGDIWKDQNDTVWQVSEVNTKNRPSIVFFERPALDSKTISVKSAFSIERGWKMVLTTEPEDYK